MAEARAPNALVEQFKRGGVPKDLRLMAAQGALPLKPGDLLELLHFLLGAPEAEVSQAASESLARLPVAELLPVLKDRETPPDLLGWALSGRSEKELREAVLQNHSTPDEAVAAAAPTLTQELAELVVINQTRLLRSLPLLEALESNAGLNNDQRRRLRELRETFRIGEEPEAPPPPPPPPPAAAPEAAPAAEAPLEEAPAPQSDGEAVARYLTDEEQQDEEKVSAVSRIYRMSAAEKVILALKGDRQERTILIRDPNRLVCAAVLGSPRITDAEIEGISAMKNVSDEVLRRIGNNREWMKRYQVVANLVKNPRTPLGISIGLVPRLSPRDMKSLAIDRNVPEPIRKSAQRFVKGDK